MNLPRDEAMDGVLELLRVEILSVVVLLVVRLWCC